ncbi:MAG: NADP-dependent oxidoreductase [Gammaproteobacteria bacterium]
MKAVTTRRYGGPNVLLWTESPMPRLTPDAVLVRVRASSVNPVDWKVRRGDVRLFSGLRPPKILGSDFAGDIVDIGAGVKDFSVNERVFGMLNAFRGGAYAEYVTVNASHVAHIPDQLSYLEAACLPLVSLTLYDLLFSHRFKRVLINGCGGGLGHIAVQMAIATGAYVTGACSTRNQALAKALGCDRVLDYTRQELENHQEHYDLVLDTAGTLTFRKARRWLQPAGCFVSSIPSAHAMLIAPLLNRCRHQREAYIWVKPDGKKLARIGQLAEEGKLKAHIGAQFSLQDIRTAHTVSEQGTTPGKIALLV